VDGEVEESSSRRPILGVVVAAGSSSRMGGTDKLDAVLAGKTVLRRSVEALAAGGAERIVIVTSADRVARIAAADWLPDSVSAVVAGGVRRQESVAAGIASLVESLDGRFDGLSEDEGSWLPDARPDEPVVLVHDAARPLASPALVRAVAQAAGSHGAAIPVVPVAETLKRVRGGRVGETVDRTDVVTAQTPQGARLGLLAKAYRAYPADGPETWTDEASLLEACRIPVQAIPGEPTNLKVTVPADLEQAQAMLEAGLVPGLPAVTLLRERAAAGRIGLGTDGHSFGPGGPLALGGILIDGAPRLVGHSDGDAALHAVADALLGASGMGDLGRLFPADERAERGVASTELLRAVAARVRAAGWRVASVDLTITAARPKLAGLLPPMEAAIARAIGIEPDAVNVKASTGNLAGPEGAGRSISASAVAWLVPQDSEPVEAARGGPSGAESERSNFPPGGAHSTDGAGEA
jgi:2-C-methyl-D-erythritol 4-phosphate cytidylyltransferase / 2-C-methyl-D-erythritol 2,4-cyclodiphosphate synthase